MYAFYFKIFMLLCIGYGLNILNFNLSMNEYFNK